jgi:dCMP deaminase
MELGRKNIKDCLLFTTVYPCLFCAKIIVGSGIKTVYYAKEYKSELTKVIFKAAKVEVIQWKIAGKNI